jgi:5-methylcytosine-specific restriction endonuclease McrA
MSRRAGPLLKDVIPPWPYGPIARSRKHMARALAARRAAAAQTSVSLDPNSPPEFARSCLPENAHIEVRKSELGVRRSEPGVRSAPKLENRSQKKGPVELPIPLPGSRRHTSWVKQQGRCHYCTQLTALEHWTIDHMTPRSRGGKRHFANEIGSCYTCNHAKRNLTAAEFLATEYVRRRREVAR